MYLFIYFKIFIHTLKYNILSFGKSFESLTDLFYLHELNFIIL